MHHILAKNPSVPPAILEKLGNDRREEVITGYASNPAVEIDDILRHRTIGEYSLVNAYIARNPNVPPEILTEMYKSKEAGTHGLFLAANINCPEEILWEIFNDGSYTSLSTLALNPSIPPQMALKLEEIANSTDNKAIMTGLRINPTYQAIQETRK